MKIPKIVLKTALILAFSTLVLFFFVQIFFKTDQYIDGYDFQFYKTALIINSFVLPIGYSLVCFRMLFIFNKEKSHSFLVNFRYSFMSLFLGSLISITVIFLYLNYFDTDSIKILTNQQLDWMLSLGTEEDEVKMMRDSIESSGSREVNIFSLKRVYGIYLPAIIVFHLFVSFVLGTFFKK